MKTRTYVIRWSFVWLWLVVLFILAKHVEFSPFRYVVALLSTLCWYKIGAFLDKGEARQKSEGRDGVPFEHGVNLGDTGQHSIFNFETPGADLDFAAQTSGSLTRLVFTRKREGEPDDSLLLWVKTEWIERIMHELKRI